MSIVFSCNHCGKQLTVGEESVGKKARCPACNTIVVVPSDAAKMQDPPTAFGTPGASAPNSRGLFSGTGIPILRLAKFAIVAGVAIILLVFLINGMMFAALMSTQAEINTIKKEVKEPPLKSDYKSDEDFSKALDAYQKRVEENKKKIKDLEDAQEKGSAAWLGSLTWKIVVLTLAYILALAGCAGLFLFGSDGQSQTGIVGLFLLLISMAFTLPPTLISFMSLIRGW